MVASYSGLYEECDVEHINVPPQPTRAKPCVLETPPQRADNFAHSSLVKRPTMAEHAHSVVVLTCHMMVSMALTNQRANFKGGKFKS